MPERREAEDGRLRLGTGGATTTLEEEEGAIVGVVDEETRGAARCRVGVMVLVLAECATVV